VTSGSGDVYASRDGGTSWTEIEHAPRRTAQFIGPWSDLSCNGTSVWLGMQLLCAAACAATSPYEVAHSADGSSWSAMASDWPEASSSTAPIANLAAVASGPRGRGVIVDLPTEGSSPPISSRLRILAFVGNTYATATIPALPASSTVDNVHVCGVSLVGLTGWPYFFDTAVGSADKPRAEPVVWKTTDGGSSWHLAASGPSQPPPPAE
jgi:hypothetical protein